VQGRYVCTAVLIQFRIVYMGDLFALQCLSRPGPCACKVHVHSNACVLALLPECSYSFLVRYSGLALHSKWHITGMCDNPQGDRRLSSRMTHRLAASLTLSLYSVVCLYEHDLALREMKVLLNWCSQQVVKPFIHLVRPVCMPPPPSRSCSRCSNCINIYIYI
jgi:hypothetical protein